MAEQAVSGPEQGIDKLSQTAKVAALALSKAIDSDDFADRLSLAIDLLDDEDRLRFLSRGLSMAAVVLRDVELPPKPLPEPKIIEMPPKPLPEPKSIRLRPYTRPAGAGQNRELEIIRGLPGLGQEVVLAGSRIRNFFEDAFGEDSAQFVAQHQTLPLFETIRNLYLQINEQPKTAPRSMNRLMLFTQGLSDSQIAEALGEEVQPGTLYANRALIIDMLHRAYTLEQLQDVFKLTITTGQAASLRIPREDTNHEELDESDPANALAIKFFTRVFNQSTPLIGITNAQAKELYGQVVSAYLSLHRKKQLAKVQVERLQLTVSGYTDEEIAEKDTTGETTVSAIYQGRRNLIIIVQKGRTEAELAEILDEVLNKDTLLIPELENTTGR